MDNETRFHIQKLQEDLSNLRQKSIDNAAYITNLQTRVEDLETEVKDLRVEIEILKQGGNL